MIIIVGYDGNHDVIAHMLEIDFQLFWCLFLQGISIDKSYKRLPHLIMTLSSSSCFTSFEFVGEVEIWEGYSMVRHSMAQHILIKMHSIIKWIYIKLFTHENRAEKNDKSSFAIWFWPKMLSSIHIIISHERFRVKNYISMTNDEKKEKKQVHTYWYVAWKIYIRSTSWHFDHIAADVMETKHSVMNSISSFV